MINNQKQINDKVTNTNIWFGSDPGLEKGRYMNLRSGSKDQVSLKASSLSQRLVALMNLIGASRISLFISFLSTLLPKRK